MKIGLIGTGFFAEKHSSILSKISGVDVTAFLGSSIEKAEKEARKWSNAKGYIHVEEMLDQQKLDAVYICVPPMAHGAFENVLLERNIPFFVEKPLGVREEPYEIAKRVEELGLITSVGYQWRYRDTTQKIRSILQERKVGMALGYWMDTMPMVPWWRDVNKSGGQFVEQTTHIVDLLRYLCGEIKEVYAAFNRSMMHEKVSGSTVSDVGSVTLTLHNGIIATILNTCILPKSYKVGLELYTNQGVLEVSIDEARDVREGSIKRYSDELDPYVVENKIFLDAVRTGDPSSILSTYQDAVKTHQVTTATGHSAMTGKPVIMESI
ncbi:putative dehydrogenase [Bacillus mesophilus]|uniref:Gfo/Idh/MocA family oxidoreductase n=1 Tax=Bacillus mesophilus TaxID=1808955 RepID=A0A6M0QAS4_9BACI|nr:Gfo/Idh/MocA family oxidoreductase [Bacillus mesophilus]MBM7662822.1 putative dehydrogenase [Bacillus mesophilus]NEY73412.1 Gfo/Idh/MocA family oxidoreductase [Bacillus mesophilus]